MSATTVEALVEGGKANPGPPLGPALGPLGVNIKAIVDKINETTKDFAGMKVPVSVIVQEDKTFEIEVGVPPTSALLAKEAGVEKGSGEAGTEPAADLKMESIIKVAKMKQNTMLAFTLKNAAKEVLGTAFSAGYTIEGRSPQEIQQAITAGEFDSLFS
ncbi:MAG: 50S ribosomal protein L11 [Candidatus Heimdallarchaeota archaeon]